MDNPPPDHGGRTGKPVQCPRCQSSNTKFCYYNNHNVNQPRHFCRDCQRYWTAGGSLRNVPVGAGKRKHKGLQGIPPKPENLPNIFSFHPDHGVFPPLDSSNVLSFKQHVASHSYGESNTVEAPATSLAQVLVNSESKPEVMTQGEAAAVRPHVTAAYVEASSIPQTRAYTCSSGQEKVGFTEIRKQPSLSLGLTFRKEADVRENEAPVIYLPDHTQPESVGKQDSRAPVYNTERDESTGCSSVTANLGSSVLEAGVESNNPTTKAPTIAPDQTTPSVLSPMAAFGASLCGPWLWPFMVGGRNGGAHVDPTMAAMSALAGMPPMNPAMAGAMASMSPMNPAMAGAMASMSPMNPAFAAAVGAMASSPRLPQIDPNVMAAITASFMQFPHLWNPYAWGLPWTTAWNMPNAIISAPSSVVPNSLNGSQKRPASPSQDQECSISKSLKREHLQEAFGHSGLHMINVENVKTVPCPAGYFDAFQSKAEVSQLKPTAMQQSGEHLDAQQHQPSPHSNPAAQARSAAFHEGN